MKKLLIGISMILILSLMMAMFPLSILAEDDPEAAPETTTVADEEAGDAEAAEEPDDAEEPGDAAEPGNVDESEDAEEADDADEPDDAEEEPEDVEEPEEPEEIPAPDTKPYKDHVIAGGVTVIAAVDFDYDDYLELGADGQYVARPEMEELGGPQTEPDNIGWTSAGEWVQYTVKVEKAGSYLLCAKAGSGGDGGPVEFYLNDEYAGEVAVANTGGWQNYVIYEAGTVELEEGYYIVKTVYPNGGMNISAIYFVELTDANPYVNHYIAGGTTVIKAIEFDNDDFNEFACDYHTAFSSSWFTPSSLTYLFRPEYAENNDGPQTENAEIPGIGNIGAVCWTIGSVEYVDDDTFWSDECEWVQYTINVLKGGTYALSIWASTDNGGSPYVDIYIDDELVGSPVIIKQGWATYNLHDVAVIELAEGTHTFRLMWPVGEANIAAFVFAEGDVFAVAPPPPAANIDTGEIAVPPAEVGGGDDGAAAGGGDAGAASGGSDENKPNPQSGDGIIFPIIVFALVAVALVTVRKVRAK